MQRCTVPAPVDNPTMTDAQIAYSLEKLKEYGIVNFGDAESLGNAMTDDRWTEFFETTVGLGVFNPTVNYKNAYTLKFVNKEVDDYLR